MCTSTLYATFLHSCFHSSVPGVLVHPCPLFLSLFFKLDPNSNEYLLAKIGFDTAENEPSKVCPLSVYRSPRFLTLGYILAVNPMILADTGGGCTCGEGDIPSGPFCIFSPAYEECLLEVKRDLVEESGRRPSGAAS